MSSLPPRDVSGSPAGCGSLSLSTLSAEAYDARLGGGGMARALASTDGVSRTIPYLCTLRGGTPTEPQPLSLNLPSRRVRCRGSRGPAAVSARSPPDARVSSCTARTCARGMTPRDDKKQEQDDSLDRNHSLKIEFTLSRTRGTPHVDFHECLLLSRLPAARRPRPSASSARLPPLTGPLTSVRGPAPAASAPSAATACVL